MADASLILAESQAYYDMQAKEVQAKAFGAMLFTPDKDGNLGFVTDITTVPRVQYNDGSSIRIHTSDAFAYFFAEFLKENADELFSRTLQKATEMVRAQKSKAATEVASQLDLSQVDDSAASGAIPAPVITSSLLTVGLVGEPITYYIIAAHSNLATAPTTYEAKNLPTGLTIDGTTGVISGTVSKAGVYPVTIIAKSVAGKDQRVLQITIAKKSLPGVPMSAAPTIYGALSATAQEGTAFTFQCTATNLPGAGVTWSTTGLPAQLVIDPATGEISGTPDAGTAGSYTVTIQVDTPGGTDTETLNLTVLTGTATTPTTTPPSITGPSTATAQEGVAASISMAASNLPSSGTGVVWSATGLPSGLSINSTTGDITGTPASGTAGTHAVTVTVTTPDGTDTATLNLTVTV